jgi:two-component system LytT family response regulator
VNAAGTSVRPPSGPVRAVVVDDEPAAREVITSFLAREPRIEVVGEAANGDEAVELVRRLSPDLLFLDVQMPDLDGFGVLAALGDDVPPGLVFVTAHDEHALRAFEVHAVDYLLKPFGRPRFEASVDQALRRLEAKAALEMRRTLASLIDGQRARGAEPGTFVSPNAAGAEGPASGAPARIGVRRGPRTILLDVAEVDWVEAAGDYARLHSGPEAYLVSSRMHELEERLAAGPFLRIHRSAIVNLAKVAELRREPDGGGVVLLGDGVRLRVARTRWEDLEQALGLGN